MESVFLCSVFMLASCSQQNNALSNSGEPVAALGKGLMHIFEDSKHTYWFGSSGEGVFRGLVHILGNIIKIKPRAFECDRGTSSDR
ncbi:MAG: hypothetical protein RL226_27 [Bacteroidota bacterium]